MTKSNETEKKKKKRKKLLTTAKGSQKKMRFSEKDQTLQKYLQLKSQNKERKVKNETGEEIEGIKCYKK